MKVVRIRPRADPPEKLTKQCCVDVSPPSRNPLWRKLRYEQRSPLRDHTKCMRMASYVIDGKYYCTSHAGKVALAQLENEK